MTVPAPRPLPVRVLCAPLTPVAVWLLAFGVFTAHSVGHLLGALEPAILQLPAKIAAYVTAATTALLIAGLTVAFGLSCGVTLRWLEGAVDARGVAHSVCRGTWVFAAYTSVVGTASFGRPPRPLTRDDLIAMASDDPGAEALLAMPWLTELQYAAGVAFLLVVFALLANAAGRMNTAIAVAFSASVVALGSAALRALAAMLQA